ncbi:LexA family protein [Eremococcus coleocola]|uniref:LexA family protein n=1 Tax=Eremococcus coleocola TaxID=88132 RepID=UPI00042170BF|nr:XRE family transcriptional regulator [Eremococcus coleocola]
MTSNIIFGQMIDYYRRQKGLTMEELGKELGKAKSSISRWISGERYPKIEEIEEIAKYFNTDVETLIFGAKRNQFDITTIYNQLTPPRQTKVYEFAEYQLDEQENGKTVLIYGQTAAGEPIEYGQDIIREEATSYIPDGAEVALVINGDSMEPDFKDGSIVYYKKQPTLETGELGIFEIDGAVTFKKYKPNYEDETIHLVSLNQDYEDMIFPGDKVKVLGKVIW